MTDSPQFAERARFPGTSKGIAAACAMADKLASASPGAVFRVRLSKSGRELYFACNTGAPCVERE